MQLADKVKFALDECRMLILGAQILLGFQLHGAFQDRFDQLPGHTRALHAVALGLMLWSVALLIAPGPYHRLVEEGDDSWSFHRLVTLYATLALMPFALALGVDLFIVGERALGVAAGMAVGAAGAMLALTLWYAVPQLRRRTRGTKERGIAMRQPEARVKTPPSQKIDQALTEGRVILPGAQALLGFQLAIVVTAGFEKLPVLSQGVHIASLCLVAFSIMLLMAPAAYHRIVFAGEDAPDMYRVASGLITAATLPLALGLTGDLYVVIAKIGGQAIGASCAMAALFALVGVWYALPLAARWSGHGADGYKTHPAE